MDEKTIEEVEEYFRKTGKRQSGILTFENLSAHDCPHLDWIKKNEYIDEIVEHKLTKNKA